jgi:hypothetical protein
VPESASGRNLPPAFSEALRSLRSATLRPELIVTEIASPAGLAPYAAALAGDVRPSKHGTDSLLGTGRFVLLYDPSEPDAWGAPFRIVSFAQAPLETDIGLDPFVADVAWSWLVDSLDARHAHYDAPSGTATKSISTGYGELADQIDGAQLELRASWTPLDTQLASHVEAWSDLLCMLAGLPPSSDAVPLLPSHRVARG